MHINTFFFFFFLLFHLVQQSSDNTQESRRNLCAEQGKKILGFNASVIVNKYKSCTYSLARHYGKE